MSVAAGSSRQTLCLRCSHEVVHTAVIVEEGRIQVVCHLCHLQWVVQGLVASREIDPHAEQVCEQALCELCQFLQSLPVREGRASARDGSSSG